MGKVFKYVMDAALIAGAIAMTVVTGGGGMYALAGAIQMTAAQVSAVALAMGTMGAGMMLSSIGQAMQGGGTNSSSISVKNAAGNRQTIYGQTRTSGTTIYMSNGNGSIAGNVIYQVIAWASHPCQSVDYLYESGREVYFTGYGHNAVAGAQGYCDENKHTDQSGNTYNFYGPNGTNEDGGNYHLACWSTLGSYSGQWLSQLGAGSPPPGGHYNFYGDPKWSSNCTLNGICATAVAAASNPNIFTTYPQMKAAIHGKNNIYDPRLDGTGFSWVSPTGTPPGAACAWTDNAALIIADLLVNKDYGFGYTWDEIDIQQLIAAANICDQPVTLASGKLTSWQANYKYTIGQTIVDSNGRQQTVTGYYNNGANQAKSGGSAPTWQTTQGSVTYDNQIVWTAGIMGSNLTEKQYTINGVIDWATSPGDTLQQMLEACAGRICIWNGQVKIFPGAWYGLSGVSYGLSDIVGKFNFKQKKYRDVCNAVRAKYTCPSYPYNVIGYDKHHKDGGVFDGQFQPTDAPEYAQDVLHGYGSDVNLAADGNVKLYQDKSYSFVQSCCQAQRLMKIYLLRTRKLWSGTIRVGAKALRNAPNDIIQLTIPQYGWNNKNFEITEIRHVIQTEDNQPPQILWELDLQETDPSIYSWSAAEERGITNTNSPLLLDTTLTAPVTNVVLQSDNSTTVTALDGTKTPRILVTWTEPADTFVTGGGYIYVYYQKNGDTAWTPLPPLAGDSTQAYIGHVVAGQQYNVKVTAGHASGSVSDPVVVGPITVGTTYSNFVSTVLNNQGSILPTQNLIIPWTSTTNSVTFTWSQQSMLRPDGSTLTVPSGTLTYSSLSSGTNFYTYWYASAADGTLHQTNGTPPPTTPNATMMAQTAADGRYSVGVIKCWTTSSGGSGGTGGGGDVCPEAAELVEVKDKGTITVGTVQIGDYLKGYDFTNKCDVYRRVVQVNSITCATWRMVDGHRVSPCEQIFHEGEWKPAYRATGSTVDMMCGRKVQITVEANEDGDHNYWLVDETPLLIHNMMANPC